MAGHGPRPGYGLRYTFRNMVVTRISHYEKLIHHEELRTVWRYAFRAREDGRKFVYSGIWLPVQTGDTCDFRATGNMIPDDYGNIRLKRLTLIEKIDGMEQML